MLALCKHVLDVLRIRRGHTVVQAGEVLEAVVFYIGPYRLTLWDSRAQATSAPSDFVAPETVHDEPNKPPEPTNPTAVFQPETGAADPDSVRSKLVGRADLHPDSFDQQDLHVRPTCYNRRDFPGVWKPGCPHWHAGGNAILMKVGYDVGGKTFPWTSCTGCTQKARALEEEKLLKE